VVTVDDMTRLAVQRLWERLESGTITVSVSDVAALLRLQRETRQDSSRPDPRWAASVTELLWIARKYVGDSWPEFASDVRKDPLLLAMWPRPDRG